MEAGGARSGSCGGGWRRRSACRQWAVCALGCSFGAPGVRLGQVILRLLVIPPPLPPQKKPKIKTMPVPHFCTLHSPSRRLQRRLKAPTDSRERGEALRSSRALRKDARLNPRRSAPAAGAGVAGSLHATAGCSRRSGPGLASGAAAHAARGGQQRATAPLICRRSSCNADGLPVPAAVPRCPAARTPCD